jgi:hypothetical protein
MLKIFYKIIKIILLERRTGLPARGHRGLGQVQGRFLRGEGQEGHAPGQMPGHLQAGKFNLRSSLVSFFFSFFFCLQIL